MSMSAHVITTALFLTLVGIGPVLSDDWPHLRGPSHNGISSESGWRDNWTKDGPEMLWSHQVGTGFSSIAVADGQAYTVGNRGDEDTIYCFDAAAGTLLWTQSYPAVLGPKFNPSGPGSTPTVEGNRVYTLSKWGDLYCFNISNGEIVWHRSLVSDEDVRVPDFGFNGSPLVYQDLLIVNVGGAGIALRRRDGITAWKSDDSEAGYSTPYPYSRAGGDFVIVSSSDSYTSVVATTGERRWTIRWTTPNGVNASDPIVSGDEVFVASGYHKGAGLFRLEPAGPVALWANKSLRAQQNGPVLIDGHLYGFDGDSGSRAKLKCVVWSTGETLWETEDFGFGSLMAADGRLIVLGAQGDLAVGLARVEGFNPTSKAKVIDGNCWAVPVLANGRIYCRNNRGQVICLNVQGR